MCGCEGCHDYFQGINLVLYNYLLKIVYLDQYMGGSLVWINGVFIQDTWIQQSVWVVCLSHLQRNLFGNLPFQPIRSQ